MCRKMFLLVGLVFASAAASASGNDDIFKRILQDCESFLSVPVKSDEISVNIKDFEKRYPIEPSSDLGKGLIAAARETWLEQGKTASDTERVLTEELHSISESPVLSTPQLKFRVAFIAYSFFRTDYFLLVTGKDNKFVSAQYQGSVQGKLPERWAKENLLVLKTELKKAAALHVAQRVDKTHLEKLYQFPELTKEEGIEWYDKLGKPLVLAEGGRFMGFAYHGDIEIRSTRTNEKVSQFSLAHADPESVRLLSLSQDGSRVAYSYEDARNNQNKLIVYDLKKRRTLYVLSDSEAFYPEVQFGDVGFLVNPNFEKSIAPRAYFYSYETSDELYSFNLNASSIRDFNDNEIARQPYKMAFNESDESLLLFYTERPPVRLFRDEAIKEYSDPHLAREESEITRMLGLGTYSPIGIGWSKGTGFASQIRSYGSGIDLSLESWLVLFDSKGQKYDNLGLLWDINNSAFSHDGKYLAVAMPQINHPVLDPNRIEKMIWIYDTKNLSSPKWIVQDLKIFTVDQMELDTAGGNLMVRSHNSANIHRIHLPGLAGQGK